MLLGLARAVGWTGDDPSLNLSGVWRLESYTVAGEETEVVPYGNTLTRPWLRFEDEAIRGHAGCNNFAAMGVHTTEAGFSLEDAWHELAGCELMVTDGNETEEFLMNFLWEHRSWITMRSSGPDLIWSAGDTTLTFSRGSGA